MSIESMLHVLNGNKVIFIVIVIVNVTLGMLINKDLSYRWLKATVGNKQAPLHHYPYTYYKVSLPVWE